MPSACRVTLVVATTAPFAAGPAFAGQRHHHPAHHATSPNVYEKAYPSPYADGWQAEAIARATEQMQNAPGVTNELAPDAKATATGGPSGGVPGFSGH